MVMMTMVKTMGRTMAGPMTTMGVMTRMATAVMVEGEVEDMDVVVMVATPARTHQTSSSLWFWLLQLL